MARIEAEEPLVEVTPPPIDSVAERIGQYVSMLVDDGATLQFGIGKIPRPPLNICNHKDQAFTAKCSLTNY